MINKHQIVLCNSIDIKKKFPILVNLIRLNIGAKSRLTRLESVQISVLGWVSESCVLCLVCVCFVRYFRLVIVLLLCCSGKSSEFWSSGSGQDAELSGSSSFVSLFFCFCFHYLFFLLFFFPQWNFGMIIWFMVKKNKEE